LQVFSKKKRRAKQDRKKAPLEKINKSIRTEYIKAQNFEQKSNIPLEFIKCQFGFRKAYYRGLAKNRQ